MANRKSMYTLMIIVVLFLGITCKSIDAQILSGVNREYEITITGNYTILEVDFELVNITIFNYIYIALDTLDKSAGYSYGIIIIYDPDEEAPILYLMAGSGNSWYRIMNVDKGDRICFSILIDHINKTIYYVVNDKVGNVNKSMIIMPRGVSIILDSIGREFSPPSIYLKKLVVLDTNNSQAIDYFIENNFNKIYEISIIRLNKTKIEITPTQSPTTLSSTPLPNITTSTHSPPQVSPYMSPTTVLLIILMTIVAATTIILITSVYRRKRSPGP